MAHGIAAQVIHGAASWCTTSQWNSTPPPSGVFFSGRRNNVAGCSAPSRSARSATLTTALTSTVPATPASTYRPWTSAISRNGSAPLRPSRSFDGGSGVPRADPDTPTSCTAGAGIHSPTQPRARNRRPRHRCPIKRERTPHRVYKSARAFPVPVGGVSGPKVAPDPLTRLCGPFLGARIRQSRYAGRGEFSYRGFSRCNARRAACDTHDSC